MQPSRPTQIATPKKSKFPWLPLVLLLSSVYLFWILPFQWGEQPVKVEFVSEAGR
ncbi:MAG TPA: hypothetical protein PKA27_14530 [Fimbriimonadaceae bacterium]|nr:hypothetical protein [Fimbriimonadaceae bacterium]